MKTPEASCRREWLEWIRNLERRPERERSGLQFVEGVRGVLHARDAGIEFHTIVLSEVLLTNSFAAKRVRQMKRAGVRVERVTPEEFRGISVTERASGVAAVLKQHWTPLREADPRRGLCWVAVGLVRSQGNLGTMIRTAEAVGAAGFVFLGRETDPFDPAVVRASMGGIFPLQLVRATISEFAAWTRANRCRVVGTSPAATASYTEVPLEAPIVVMFGEERAGLTDDERAACTHIARIPIVGRADSLNVGVAAGVILYEVLRRRGTLPAFERPDVRSLAGEVERDRRAGLP
ncbi:MAG: RNA methyltransferase TrmH [Planctomycetota bacterium]|nr:MAG: RNA methyltransferase TrmH [Planctomycetota bacterium]